MFSHCSIFIIFTDKTIYSIAFHYIFATHSLSASPIAHFVMLIAYLKALTVILIKENMHDLFYFTNNHLKDVSRSKLAVGLILILVVSKSSLKVVVNSVLVSLDDPLQPSTITF